MSITGATYPCKIDLQPDATALSQLVDDGTTALWIEAEQITVDPKTTPLTTVFPGKFVPVNDTLRMIVRSQNFQTIMTLPVDTSMTGLVAGINQALLSKNLPIEVRVNDQGEWREFDTSTSPNVDITDTLRLLIYASASVGYYVAEFLNNYPDHVDVFTAHAIGAAPTTALTVQCTITEVAT